MRVMLGHLRPAYLMARKVKRPSPQLGLSLPTVGLTPSGIFDHATGTTVIQSADLGSAKEMATSTLIDSSPHESTIDLDTFDDYDDSGHINGTPRLRLLDPPKPSPRVIVEAAEDVFWVSRLRDNGTTSATVMWTRSELEELQSRISAALEVSDGGS